MSLSDDKELPSEADAINWNSKKKKKKSILAITVSFLVDSRYASHLSKFVCLLQLIRCFHIGGLQLIV